MTPPRGTRVIRLLSATVLVLVAAPAIAAASTRLPDSPTPHAAGFSLITEPADGFGSVYRFIARATKSVDMTMYELNDTTAEQDLVTDAKRGVDVRVILDREYSGDTYNQSAYSYLSRHGVQVRWGPSDTIVHQKTIVDDGTTALIATFNLANTSDYYATTRDFGVFDSTRSDVAAIIRVFDADWAGAPVTTPPPSDDGADLVWSPGSAPDLGAVIGGARHSLLVENEEMDDSAVVAALSAAAHRGVNVEVVMTDDSSWDGAFDQLVSAGVHLSTYAESARLYIHAKVIVADAGMSDERLFLGSENFSVSSLDYNRELGIVASSPPLVSSVAATVRADFDGARSWTG